MWAGKRCPRLGPGPEDGEAWSLLGAPGRLTWGGDAEWTAAGRRARSRAVGTGRVRGRDWAGTGPGRAASRESAATCPAVMARFWVCAAGAGTLLSLLILHFHLCGSPVSCTGEGPVDGHRSPGLQRGAGLGPGPPTALLLACTQLGCSCKPPGAGVSLGSLGACCWGRIQPCAYLKHAKIKQTPSVPLPRGPLCFLPGAKADS